MCSGGQPWHRGTWVQHAELGSVVNMNSYCIRQCNMTKNLFNDGWTDGVQYGPERS